jgi:methanogenic corrinoid protein MtbC1
MDDAALRALTEALLPRYLDAQLEGDRREAVRLVIDEGLGRGASVEELFARVIEPAQVEIGERWQRNEISIAEEHLATAISQLVISHLYERLPRAERNGHLVIVACAPGEQHALGARVAADSLEMAGFHVRFLGANVPADGLAALVKSTQPDLVVVSAATSLCFPGLREMLEAIRSADARVPVFVGGRAFRWSDECEVPHGVVHAGKDARDLVHAAREAVAA